MQMSNSFLTDIFDHFGFHIATLHTAGEYPARYRPLIWRFLLRLPENSNAFSALGEFLVKCDCVETV